MLVLQCDMQTILLSVLGIYSFVLVGFMAKTIFRDRIDEKSLTLLSVYFLQIFLTFWGLLRHPIDASVMMTPLLYSAIIGSSLLISTLVATLFFRDAKERSIATVAALIGNTGNLGIPLCIVLFGEQSIIYTTVINLTNVFFVYTVGVFYYARGSFSIKMSLIKIFQLPAIYAAIIAVALNLQGVVLPENIDRILMMGAYASMVVQLLIFGIYLQGVRITHLSAALSVWVSLLKFIIIPLIAFAILFVAPVANAVKAILFIELIMPLAVANVNLAALYDCRPRSVTSQVLITSILFVGVLFIALEVITYF